MYIVVRYTKEWWESDKHIAVMAMTEVLCLTWLSIQTCLSSIGWFHWVVLWDLACNSAYDWL